MHQVYPLNENLTRLFIRSMIHLRAYKVLDMIRFTYSGEWECSGQSQHGNVVTPQRSPVTVINFWLPQAYTWIFHVIVLFGSRGSFKQKIVKFVLASHFHKKMRTDRGLVPTPQLLQWCYIPFEQTNCEQNDLIETPTLGRFFAKQLR